MGLHTATKLNHWVKSAEAKTLHAGRLNIGPRLILGFVFIILSMLAADAVILWQFQNVTGKKYQDVTDAYMQAVHSVLTGEKSAPEAAAALENELVRITGFKKGPPPGGSAHP